MMPMEVIDNTDEESNDENINLTEEEENDIIAKDDSDDNWLLFILFIYLFLSMKILFTLYMRHKR